MGIKGSHHRSQKFHLRPGLTESSVERALNGSLPSRGSDPVEDRVGLEMGQHRGCPPALRLARTYAAQHHQSWYARCGHWVKAGVVVRLSHPLQSAWIPCAPRGPPSPHSCRRRPRHRQMNHTTLSLTGDKNCLAVTFHGSSKGFSFVNRTLPIGSRRSKF